MAQRPLEQLTFREKIRDCSHRARELVEHIDQNLVPHLHELHKRTRPPRTEKDEQITDVTVRNLVAAALESHRYAAQVEDQIEAYGKAIEGELGQILKPPPI
jgi:hypothetical protein